MVDQGQGLGLAVLVAYDLAYQAPAAALAEGAQDQDRLEQWLRPLCLETDLQVHDLSMEEEVGMNQRARTGLDHHAHRALFATEQYLLRICQRSACFTDRPKCDSYFAFMPRCVCSS